jgi:hypothetical protein
MVVVDAVEKDKYAGGASTQDRPADRTFVTQGRPKCKREYGNINPRNNRADTY